MKRISISLLVFISSVLVMCVGNGSIEIIKYWFDMAISIIIPSALTFMAWVLFGGEK